MILKTAKKWPSILGITQGGAKFDKLSSYSTSLSGINLSYQLPESVLGEYSLILPPENLELASIDWEEGEKSATQFFKAFRISRNTWWYWGNFFKSLFEPIGNIRMEWQVSKIDPKYNIEINDSQSVLAYLKAYIYDLYEGKNGINEEIRKHCYDFYVKNGSYPAEHYKDEIAEMVQRKSKKIPDNFKMKNIHNVNWVSFSVDNSDPIYFHITSLNDNYLIINLAKLSSDFQETQYRWFNEAIQIIDFVMSSVKLE
ncbi:hypothetical protein [Aliikangiella maris]|uniref:TIGR04255 family protein n=2 Tax=Aliikangiella maris TaxID=3162458 RepID=A0ABV3MIV8_9GAMM